MWPESKKVFAPFKTKTRMKPQLTHEFPSGATLQFMHMQHDGDEEDHQGLQFSAVFFDELTHFHEHQVIYLMSRLRSDAESDSYMIGSCNPDPD